MREGYTAYMQRTAKIIRTTWKVKMLAIPSAKQRMIPSTPVLKLDGQSLSFVLFSSTGERLVEVARFSGQGQKVGRLRGGNSSH